MAKKLIGLIICVCAMCMSAEAQTMKDMVLSMPDSVMPLLTKDNRADFIDFLANRMRAKVKNVFNEYAYMDTLTADYTFIRPTQSSDVAIKLLPLTDSTKVICMVHTYRADGTESVLRFFDTKWRPLDVAGFVTVPSLVDFVKTRDADSLQLVKDKFYPVMIVGHLSPENTDLRFTLNDAFFPREDKALVKGCILTEIVKKWEKGRYVSK